MSKIVIIGDHHCSSSPSLKMDRMEVSSIQVGDWVDTGVTPELMEKNLKELLKVIPLVEIKSFADLLKLQLPENHDMWVDKTK